MIINQKFFNDYIKSVNFSELRTTLQLQRLRLDKPTISFYLFCMFLHTSEQKSFTYIHKNYFLIKYKTKYSTFMHNVNKLAKLAIHIFNYVKKLFNIKKTTIAIVDTTLIEEKKQDFINRKNWKNHRVTTRKKKHICGSKGLIFLNDKKQVIYANLLSINYSDHNILKNSAYYQPYLSKYLLADRGFNNKIAKTRLKTFNCKLISPNQVATVKKTGKYFESELYKKLYSRRWKIETLFQKIKHNYADFKLNLTGRYTLELKKAKFLLTIISYNLSTII